MRGPQITAIGEHLYWSYANLGMAHAALSDGALSYGRMHYIIRSKLYAGLTTGSMRIGSLKDDERLKMLLPQACCYCGSTQELSLDHLIPAKKGGLDIADNLVWACKRCNSSKGATDLLEWYQRHGGFPPLLLLRRYLKIVISFSVENALMETSIVNPPALPFSLDAIPLDYPDLRHLRLWIIPLETTATPCRDK